LTACFLIGNPVTASRVEAQAPQSHEVRRGDTLFAVARKSQHAGVSRNQMIAAIYRANQAAFPGGNAHLLEVGTVLTIPSREATLALGAGEADRLVRELIARPATPASQVAAAKPAPAVTVPTPAGVSRPPLGREEAARRYREGLALEREGNHQGALQAFLEAGEGGHGLAQRRLGEIYDKGSPAAPRDYQAALLWYQKAREQGVEIPKPFVRSPR